MQELACTREHARIAKLFEQSRILARRYDVRPPSRDDELIDLVVAHASEATIVHASSPSSTTAKP